VLRVQFCLKECLYEIIIGSVFYPFLSMNLLKSFIGTIISGFVGAFIALWLDTFNNPDIEISITEQANTEGTYPMDKPVPGHFKFFGLSVKNKEIPPFLPKRFFNREAAEQLDAKITFIELNKTMKGRWTTTLELPFANPQDAMRLANFPESKNILAGVSENLCVFVKFEKDIEAYGWNNEGYLHQWRTPDYRLNPGIYNIEVVIEGLNVKKKALFKINVAQKLEDCSILSP